MYLNDAVVVIFVFVLLILLLSINAFCFALTYKIAKKVGVMTEKEVREKEKSKVEKEKEESDKAFTNMLVELSAEKQARENEKFGAYTFEELDVFDELEHTEKDPDKLLKILEYGLPDEELEAIIKELEAEE